MEHHCISCAPEPVMVQLFCLAISSSSLVRLIADVHGYIASSQLVIALIPFSAQIFKTGYTSFTKLNVVTTTISGFDLPISLSQFFASLIFIPIESHPILSLISLPTISGIKSNAPMISAPLLRANFVQRFPILPHPY